MKAATLFLLGLLALSGLSACSGADSRAASSPVFHAEDSPQMLSEWGLFDVSSGALVLSEGVVPYDLNTPLFTDYAHKLRTIWLPETAPPARFRDADYPNFPVGTVISKTFYYPKSGDGDAVLKIDDPKGMFNPMLLELDHIRLMETRLLVRRDTGWTAVSYVWNDVQTEAKLMKIGDAQNLTLVADDGGEQDFVYIVPDINQCAGCHAPNNTTRELVPLGVRPSHLNKLYLHGSEELNQLQHMEMVGYLTGLNEPDEIRSNVDWSDISEPLNLRARAYLDINCSHCHNPAGPADTSGLDLTVEVEPGPSLGLCKLPIAAGSGTGGKTFGIVPGAPDESILMHRIESVNPAAMMPELGRSLQHKEGAALIREWISEMEGECSS